MPPRCCVGGAFWKLDAIISISPNYASKMSDWRSLEKLKAMILSEDTSEMPHWKDFRELGATILLEFDHASKMSDWGASRKLKTMILSEYASEMPRWQAFRKLDAKILLKYALKTSDRGNLGGILP